MMRFFSFLVWCAAATCATACSGASTAIGNVPVTAPAASAPGIPTNVPTGAPLGTGTAAPVAAPAVLPCDIYARSGTPCVAAHSSTRRLVTGYQGPLYRVTRATDKATLDVGLSVDGYANAAAQDAFCPKGECVITTLYDQSMHGNDLTVAGPGGNAPAADTGVVADQLPVTAGGRKVYGMYFNAGMGYRIEHTVGIATGSEPESLYMLASGTHTNGSCCFDYGNSEANAHDNGDGHMDAIYFGSECWFEWPICYGSGPWIEADMENGVFMSDEGYSMEPAYTGSTTPFVTAMLKNDGVSHFAIHDGDGQAGTLATIWDGALPSSPLNPNPPTIVIPAPNNPTGGTSIVNPPLSGYEPMHLEGAITLGIGGDGSDGAIGTFFEGVMTRGVSTDAADALVQANIVAVKYEMVNASP